MVRSREIVMVRKIREAGKAIMPPVRRSPLIPSAPLSHMTGADMRLELETVPDTRAFKMRGAMNKLLSLNAGAAGVAIDN